MIYGLLFWEPVEPTPTPELITIVGDTMITVTRIEPDSSQEEDFNFAQYRWGDEPVYVPVAPFVFEMRKE